MSQLVQEEHVVLNKRKFNNTRLSFQFFISVRSKCQTKSRALKMILVDLKFSHEKRCDLPLTLFLLLLALKALNKSQHVKRFVGPLFTTGKFSRCTGLGAAQ